ncbi:MAG TPA: ABC transporter permease, partial [Bryocella sp.]|nr:ABC transporter permease [Bryocella sp.]
MRGLLQDLRFAVRQLRKSPGFALTTILTLALGIGATTAIFSLINAVLLRPLPFPEPDRLMSAYALDQTVGDVGVARRISYPDFFDWRSRQHSFDEIASYRGDGLTLTGSGVPRRLQTYIVASDFFRVLGVDPMLGRGFLPDEEKPGTHAVVLSHETWRSVFGSAPDIVGRAITLDNNRYTVVGVMPKNFAFPLDELPPDIWVTLADDAVDPDPDPHPLTTQRGADMVEVVGRLKAGVTAAQAAADLSVIEQNLSAQYPDTNKTFRAAQVEAELESVVATTRPALRVLFAAVLFVLLIACANVAGLMLTRASRRRSEIAVRSAMGAGRGEIMRQVLVESVVLAVCGGAAGVVLSVVLLKTMLQFVPEGMPRIDHVSVDGTVLAFAAVASILTGILFGALPAWRMSRMDPALALREGTRSVAGGRGQHRLHGALVIAETAIGLVLLIGAGLLIRSFVHVLNVDPGFDPRHVLTAELSLPDVSYPQIKKPQFYDQLLARLRALPGVESVAAGAPVPLSHHNVAVGFEIEGRPAPIGEEPISAISFVTPGFFQTLRIPLLSGRDFLATDNSAAPPVVIINQAFARKYFP